MSTRKGRFQPNGEWNHPYIHKLPITNRGKSGLDAFRENQSFLFSSSRILTAIS